MTAHPPQHGTSPPSLRRWATACVASARILRSQGHPGQAADLQDAADHALTADAALTAHAVPTGSLDHPGTDRADRGGNVDVRGDDTGTGDAAAYEDVVGEVPSWWR